MSRGLRILLSLVAGLTACFFEIFVSSMTGVVGMILCLVCWWYLRKPFAPLGAYGHPIFGYFCNAFILISVVYIVGGWMLPLDLHLLLNGLLNAWFLVLVLAFAYSDYRYE